MGHTAQDAEFVALNIAILTVSDTRTAETDKAGQLLRDPAAGADRGTWKSGDGSGLAKATKEEASLTGPAGQPGPIRPYQPQSRDRDTQAIPPLGARTRTQSPWRARVGNTSP